MFLAEGLGRCRERSIHPGCDPRILDAPDDGRPLVILIKDRGQGPAGLDPVLVRRVLTTCQGAMVLWRPGCDECGHLTMMDFIEVSRATGKPVVFIQTSERFRDAWMAVGGHYIFGAGRNGGVQ